MSQELEQTQTEETTTTVVPQVNPFDETAWVEKTAEMSQPSTVEAPAVAEVIPSVSDSESPSVTVDYNEYLKSKFGFDNEEVALAEINKLKEANKSAATIKFENEQSEKYYKLISDGKEDDLLDFLSNKKKIERLLTSEINNTNIASEILKESFKVKYPDLSEDEIEYKIGKQFAMPEKPTQDSDELDEEYNRRIVTWEREKALVEKEIIIEAKTVRRDLESLKTNLVLPDISKPEQALNTPSQEELAALDNARKDYLQSLESGFKVFEGVKVTAKGEGVELPITFSPTDDEKIALKNALTDFDQEQYFGKRWIKEGKFDSNTIMEDYYLLENKERIFQKIANDTLAKATEHFFKTTSNIKLNDERINTPDLSKKGDIVSEAASFFFQDN
jgi:hypothetical protein